MLRMRIRTMVSLSGVSIFAIAMGVGCQQTGEPWTIEVIRLDDAGHRRSAEDVSRSLKQTPGMRAEDVYIVEKDDFSSVYYGHYYRKIDRTTGDRHIPDALRNDLKLIKDLGIAGSSPLFLHARMTPEVQPDVGRPEWNLRNANGVYTLQVAVFFPTEDVTQYKELAVAYVKQLREKGYDAYYYHADAKSIVTVGIFGQEAAYRTGGKVDYSPAVRSLQRKEHFAYNLNNGRRWFARSGEKRAPVRSLLVKIPNRKTDGGP